MLEPYETMERACRLSRRLPARAVGRPGHGYVAAASQSDIIVGVPGTGSHGGRSGAVMLREAEILRNLPIAVYATDAEGRITFYNDAAAELWGQRPELGAARWCGSWRLHWPDGRPMAHDECPMALTLRSGQPVAGAEAIAERPDGRRIRFLPFPSLVRDAAGAVTGAVNALVEVTDRAKAEIDLARLAAIVASSDDAIISKTLEGVVTSWNAGASRIFGYAPEEMIGQPILRIIPPELRHEEEGILARLRRGERVDHFDTVRVAKDGRRLFISLTVSPIRNGAGEVVGASKVARDVSERKRSEELQRVLVDELNHRVRNTLATHPGDRRGSRCGGGRVPSAFVESFTGRVQALARAHDLLVQGDMQRVELADLVRELVDAGTGDARLRWSGPPAALDSHTAVQMALVLHELASNARSYGALSQPAGRLSVDWTVAAGKRRDLRIAWRETGVAALGRRAAPGFGTLLIERALLANGGETRIRYLPDGLACDIRLPLPDDALSDLFRAVPVGIAAPPAAAEERRGRAAGARRRGRAADRAGHRGAGSWPRGARSSARRPIWRRRAGCWRRRRPTARCSMPTSPAGRSASSRPS